MPVSEIKPDGRDKKVCMVLGKPSEYTQVLHNRINITLKDFLETFCSLGLRLSCPQTCKSQLSFEITF